MAHYLCLSKYVELLFLHFFVSLLHGYLFEQNIFFSEWEIKLKNISGWFFFFFWKIPVTSSKNLHSFEKFLTIKYQYFASKGFPSHLI